MSKKQDSYYFDNFIACTDLACQAAHLLGKAIENFSPDSLPAQLEEIHRTEHAADMKKHELLNTLAKAFITPLEREDIMLLSQNIDEVTDKLEDVLIRIYYTHIQTIRPDVIPMAQVVTRCCESLLELMKEFPNFKRSKKLGEQIIRINSLEEEADRLYIDNMYRLHAESKNPIEIISWHEIYIYLERCADACEHVADVVGSVIMKNS